MAVQFSVAVQNARGDAIETAIGTAPRFRIFTGSPPANCAAASTGTQLAEVVLASDWAANASGGVKTFSNTPIAGTASAAGTAGYYRIFDNAGTTCHKQGTLGTSGTDAIINNASLTNGQAFTISSWSITDGNP